VACVPRGLADGLAVTGLDVRGTVGRTSVTVDFKYHLRNTIIRIGILNWLRFTYDFEIGPAELCGGAGTSPTSAPGSGRSWFTPT
jgi:hypothetical protein